MSGSGGGGGGGNSGGSANDSPCESLKFDAQLTSPQPAVVATLVVGDVLDIRVDKLQGQIVVKVLKGGLVAGGLTGPEATRLRNCIEGGHAYEAEVMSVNGGHVRVRVTHT